VVGEPGWLVNRRSGEGFAPARGWRHDGAAQTSRIAAPAEPHTSSDRDVLAAARFSDRRSLRDFWAGFFPAFFGFCEPFIA
jgi:hypothetical protein